jgi:hypothetical protein
VSRAAGQGYPAAPCLCYAAGSEGHRIPVVRPDFKSGEARHARLVGSTPISFRLVFPHLFRSLIIH